MPKSRPPYPPAVAAHRLRAEVAEAEPARELLACIVPLPAPATGGIVAGGIPQPAHQHAGFGELVPYPGRHHRVAPGHRQPGQGVGQRPAVPCRIGQDFAAMALAGRTREPLADRRLRLGARRAAARCGRWRRMHRIPRRHDPSWPANARPPAGRGPRRATPSTFPAGCRRPPARVGRPARGRSPARV